MNNQEFNKKEEDLDRTKYQTKYNIYHDKKDLDRSGMIVLIIIAAIITAFTLLAILT